MPFGVSDSVGKRVGLRVTAADTEGVGDPIETELELLAVPERVAGGGRLEEADSVLSTDSDEVAGGVCV